MSPESADPVERRQIAPPIARYLEWPFPAEASCGTQWAPVPYLGPTTGGNLRPWDSVWLLREGFGCRGTVVEVRNEQVRVSVGGAVHLVPSENVLGVHRRQSGARTVKAR